MPTRPSHQLDGLRRHAERVAKALLARYRHQPLTPDDDGEAWELANESLDRLIAREASLGLVDNPEAFLRTTLRNLLNHAWRSDAAERRDRDEHLQHGKAEEDRRRDDALHGRDERPFEDWLSGLRKAFDQLQTAMDERRTASTRLDYFAIFLLNARTNLDRIVLRQRAPSYADLDDAAFEALRERVLPLHPPERQRRFTSAWDILGLLRQVLLDLMGQLALADTMLDRVSALSRHAPHRQLTVDNWHQMICRAREQAEAVTPTEAWRRTFGRWEFVRHRRPPTRRRRGTA